jgi:hypothetical protein
MNNGKPYPRRYYRKGSCNWPKSGDGAAENKGAAPLVADGTAPLRKQRNHAKRTVDSESKLAEEGRVYLGISRQQQPPIGRRRGP